MSAAKTLVHAGAIEVRSMCGCPRSEAAQAAPLAGASVVR